MGSRIKEHERAEKAIRSLLKLPENRRCINCNSLGPQYVCTTFQTFICINCSGIHREFTHRVKSVSMAKFTSEEVSALRAGGNERAREIYFKEWDRWRDAYPDASNILKLRVFIKSVYVDKRYTSECNDKISQQKPAVIEDYRESKKASTTFSGCRSLHSLKFYFDGKTPYNLKPRDIPKNPIRFEIVDDRFREDGIVKRYDGCRESRGGSKSLDLSNNKGISRFPIVRHTSEVLGDSAPQLRVCQVVTVEEKKDPVINQMEIPISLIDDVPVSEPSDGTISQCSTEIIASLKTNEDPSPNSLEALLFGFSVPGTNNSELESKNHVSSTVSLDNYPAGNIASLVTLPAIVHAQSSQASSSPPALQTMEQSTLAISNSSHGIGFEHHNQDETKSSIRKALPEDLFTGGFSFASPQVHSNHHGMGYGIQYYQYPVVYTSTTKPANPFDLSYDDTIANQTPQFPYMAYVPGGLPHVSTPVVFSDSSSPASCSNGLMTSHSLSYTAALSPNSPSLESTEGNTLNAAHEANNGYSYGSRGNPFE